AFTLGEDGRLRCPAGAILWLAETRQETPDTQRLIYQARLHDCAACALRTACLGRNASSRCARRVSARRRAGVEDAAAGAVAAAALPVPAAPPAPGRPALAIRWSDLPARALQRAWLA